MVLKNINFYVSESADHLKKDGQMIYPRNTTKIKRFLEGTPKRRWCLKLSNFFKYYCKYVGFIFNTGEDWILTEQNVELDVSQPSDATKM